MFRMSTINELYAKVEGDGNGAIFTKAGAMVGFRGICKFEKVMLGPHGNPLQALMGQIGRRLTGENLPLMKASMRGHAEIYLADMAQHVVIVDLQPRMSLKVESECILAFTDEIKYGFQFLGQGVISQKGFFTSTLSAVRDHSQVAILSNGNPLVLDTPCNIDPDALVAWIGPDPVPKLDLSWKNVVGQASGESYNFEFSSPGYKVVIQPYERESGLKLGIDDKRYTPNKQQNQTFGGAINTLNNTLGNIFGNN